jgi:hypothetical protein
MLEWWQALLLAVAAATVGGVFAWIVSYSQAQWSRKAAVESDERRAGEGLAQEVRQARREQRRLRVQPFYAFLEVVRGQIAAADILKLYEWAYDADLLDVQQKYTKEQFLGAIKNKHSGPGAVELGLVMRSAMSSAADPTLEAALREVIASLQTGADPASPYKAMQAMEGALENYIANLP